MFLLGLKTTEVIIIVLNLQPSLFLRPAGAPHSPPHSLGIAGIKQHTKLSYWKEKAEDDAWMVNDESNRKSTGGRAKAETNPTKLFHRRHQQKATELSLAILRRPLPTNPSPEGPINQPCVGRGKLAYWQDAPLAPHLSGLTPLFHGSAVQTLNSPRTRLQELTDSNISKGLKDLENKAIMLSPQETHCFSSNRNKRMCW